MRLLAGLRDVLLPYFGLITILAFDENGIIILAPSNIRAGDILSRFEPADDTLAILRPCQEAKINAIWLDAQSPYTQHQTLISVH
jgi:hypothetical protein